MNFLKSYLNLCKIKISKRKQPTVRHHTFITSMASSSSSARKEGPIFFWREYDEPYGFLSQWYDCAFEHDGSTYRTAEEWMMVGKARLFGDEV